MTKLVVTLVCLLTALQPRAFGQTDDGAVTPLLLKQIQTRKFAKPPNETLRAVKTYCEDVGATNVFLLPVLADRDGNAIPSTGTVTCIYNPKFSVTIFGGLKNSSKLSQIKFEAIEVSKAHIVLRARIIGPLPEALQITDPDSYSKLFKGIGDTIFTEALALEAPPQD